MEEIKIFQEERPWGNFRQFTHNQPSTVKILTLKPNEELSIQSHKLRSEFCHFLSGAGTLEINENKYDVKAGDEYTVPTGAKHRVAAGPEGLSYLEISLGDFEEHDEIRYEDKYGRS